MGVSVTENLTNERAAKILSKKGLVAVFTGCEGHISYSYTPYQLVGTKTIDSAILFLPTRRA